MEDKNITKRKEKFLLINPPSSIKVYKKSKIKAALSEMPLLSLASLGAILEEYCKVKVLDLSLSLNPIKDLKKALDRFNPDFAGITFTTPLYNESKELVKIIKKFNKRIITIAGGVHVTSLPEETMSKTDFDIGILGEGEITIAEIVKGKNVKDIKGIFYKENEKIFKNPPRELISDLDTLPLPAWHLFNLKRYKASPLTTRDSPVGPIETSRGCVFGCTYCNKCIFGRRFRFKSPERVIKEIEHMINAGFKEIHIWDDNFVTNLNRAKKICNLIIEKNIKIKWCLACGVRVDCVDQEFFNLAKKAGCYSAYLGIEAGDQKILDRVNKGIKLPQVKKAVRMANKAGLETVGFFMFGLPDETKETMEKTIRFAKNLQLDYAKVTILVPFPSTPVYDEFKKSGYIKTDDWSKYNFHTASKVYDHPNLDWKTLERYYHKFYRSFYFRPNYILKRIWKDIKRGRFFITIKYFIKTWIK